MVTEPRTYKVNTGLAEYVCINKHENMWEIFLGNRLVCTFCWNTLYGLEETNPIGNYSEIEIDQIQTILEMILDKQEKDQEALEQNLLNVNRIDATQRVIEALESSDENIGLQNVLIHILKNQIYIMEKL